VSGRLAGLVLTVALATACSVAPEASPAPDPSSPDATATPTPAQPPSPPLMSVPPSSPPPSISPTSSPEASPGADAPRWEQIGQIAAQPYVTELLGFQAGYVAFAGEYITGSSDAWFSVDGREWQRAERELALCGVDDDGESGTDTIEAGASSGPAVLLVGSTAEVDPASGYCATRAVAWLTHDGLTWQRSEAFGGALGTVAQAAWSTPDGWEAAVAHHIEDDHEAIVRTGVWRSSDGLHWQQVADEAWEPGHLIGSGPPVAAGSDEQGTRLISTAWWVAVGPPDSPLIHSTLLRTSADGQSWNDLDAPFARGNPPGLVTHILPPGAGPGGTWLLVTHDEYLRNATGWHSADLRDWQSIDMPRQQLDAVVRLPDGLLVAGCNRAAERCGQYISADGSEWMEITPRLQGPVSVAVGPAGVLLVGVVSGRVWKLVR
jgi:hypothetical protein